MSLHLDRLREESRKTRIEAKKRNGKTLRMIMVCVVLFYLAAAFMNLSNTADDDDLSGLIGGEDFHAWQHIVVNESTALPEDFSVDLYDFQNFSVDTRIRRTLDSMIEFAKEDGVDLVITKAYEEFDSNDPYSEYPTGLSIDFSHEGLTNEEFQNSAQYIWLNENAANFGFVLRYPKGKEDITGKSFTPWHFRYIGIEAALEVKQDGLALEEFLDIYY